MNKIIIVTILIITLIIFGCTVYKHSSHNRFITSNKTHIPQCKWLWWYDNTHSQCQYKKFCGLYMYQGLHVFKTKEECEASLKHSTENIFPSGNYANKATDSVLKNPLVKGVLIAERWINIEPEEGEYNWSQLDEKIDKVSSSGKKVVLNIMTSGVNVPQWVIDKGAKTFTFKATNPHQPIYGKTFTVPLYWDETYLNYKKKFIEKLGERYANNPAVVGVMVSFASTVNNDWYIPHDPSNENELLSKGYTTDKMLQAGRETIDAWANAFPKQALKLPLGKSIPDNGNTITTLAEKIVNYAYSKYPDRFYAQINALCTKIPEASNPKVQNADANNILYLLKLLSQHPRHIGFQMLCDATKHSERLDKGHIDVSPKHILEYCINTALTYQPYYMEYWHADCENPDFQDILENVDKTMESD